jgi:hypothetical protein
MRAAASLVMTGSKRGIVVDLCAGRTGTTRSRRKSNMPENAAYPTFSDDEPFQAGK